MTELLNLILLYSLSNSSTLLKFSLFPSFYVVGMKFFSYRKETLKKNRKETLGKRGKETFYKNMKETLEKNI